MINLAFVIKKIKQRIAFILLINELPVQSSLKTLNNPRLCDVKKTDFKFGVILIINKQLVFHFNATSSLGKTKILNQFFIMVDFFDEMKSEMVSSSTQGRVVGAIVGSWVGGVHQLTDGVSAASTGAVKGAANGGAIGTAIGGTIGIVNTARKWTNTQVDNYYKYCHTRQEGCQATRLTNPLHKCQFCDFVSLAND